ncbi:RNA polymerase sigma factor [Streptomyces sp. NBC_01766]|uniref:RNA polymerase sigma factor n=1 Tax=Streptomyces sp. NBC_01766 TaxID=2975936 RepID=UPI002DDA7260|nr:RNA polymerase sigma factor [Streptomyces sp. NBC_01766]WSC20193.1 RNA polymerase sigma factor [Streptomyces sp. NBC_01766]
MTPDTRQHEERGDRAPDRTPDRDGDSDARLTRSAAGDAAAFTLLVETHSPALHGYFARRVPGAADDLLAEAWLQAYVSRRTFDASRGSARGWLFGVARNVLAQHLRRAGRREIVPGPEVTDPWQAVDQRLDAAALAPALRQALSELPAEERELLLLISWEQLTPAEAAAAVGIPAGTARSRLHRARGRLRDRLAPSRPAGQHLTVTGDLA